MTTALNKHSRVPAFVRDVPYDALYCEAEIARAWAPEQTFRCGRPTAVCGHCEEAHFCVDCSMYCAGCGKVFCDDQCYDAHIENGVCTGKDARP